MNRYQIEKQLKKEADANTPDPYDKIICAAEARGLLGDVQANATGDGKTASLAVKRPIVWLVSLALALIICLAILLPLVLNGGSPGVIPITPSASLTANDVYGLGAVSTVRLLDSRASDGASAAKAAAVFAAGAEVSAADDGVKEQAEKFNEYFTALDCFLGENVVSTVAEDNADPSYPYETKLTINGKDVGGNDKAYVMYYTETLVKSEDDGDETKSQYTLEGVMIVNGVSHLLAGEREYETEDDEVENELKIRAYANYGDKTSYVEMKQENSAEEGETETEYVYSVYENGTLVEQTAVKFETERKGDKQETEYELEFRQGEAKGKYKVKREVKDGVAQMKVSYDLDGNSGKFTVYIAVGDKYEYVFSDGTSVIF